MCKKDKLFIYLLKYYCNHETLEFNEIYNKLETHHIIINDYKTIISNIDSLSFDDIVTASFSITNTPITPTTILDNYNLIKNIGNGAYGNVYKAFNKTDNKSYALKIIKLNTTNKDNYQYHLREARYMALLEHPNIIRYYTSWIDQINNNNNLYNIISAIEFSNSNSNSNSNQSEFYENYSDKSILPFLFITMELCSYDLSHYLSTRETINYIEVINIYTQIVLGINYLHNKNIIHRDLKPSNIFISNTNKIKIGDFGMSILNNGKLQQQIAYNTVSNINFIEGSHDYGTFNYISPEIISCNKYSIYSDIYSLGIIFYELLSMFTTNMEKFILLKNLREFNIDNEFKTKYPKETQFIYRLIDTDPLKRFTTNDILKLKNIIKE